jgi:sister chromatid cohesion protein PDS5
VQGGRSGADAESQAKKATIVLSYVSKHQPVLYKSHVAELTKALQGEGQEESVVETALHAASKLCKGDSSTSVDK